MQPKTLARLALSIAGSSLFLLGYALANLANGWSEVSNHWWSALPVAGLVLAAGLGVLAIRH